ncbi:hypothetical protein [Sphingopyxis bauzanensis]|uniref:hypothetical protein n=1 Tax=Sphingopyxis bauzanensis TaxID=651663 RepID=UPI001181A7E6|nr:hypothetical protein [Sphingopyxis bauzanensis]
MSTSLDNICFGAARLVVSTTNRRRISPWPFSIQAIRVPSGDRLASRIDSNAPNHAALSVTACALASDSAGNVIASAKSESALRPKAWFSFSALHRLLCQPAQAEDRAEIFKQLCCLAGNVCDKCLTAAFLASPRPDWHKPGHHERNPKDMSCSVSPEPPQPSRCF